MISLYRFMVGSLTTHGKIIKKIQLFFFFQSYINFFEKCCNVITYIYPMIRYCGYKCEHIPTIFCISYLSNITINCSSKQDQNIRSF